MTVTRRQFNETFAAGLSTSDVARAALQRAGGDPALLQRADVDGDGSVEAGAELDVVWSAIDAVERFGWSRSVSSPRALALIGGLTPNSSATTAPTTTKPASLEPPQTLTASTLEQARAAIAAQYGDAVADRVLRDDLGLRLGALDETGVDWLQRHGGSMNGRIDRYQQALRTHLEGAHLIDHNHDGELDAGDVVWRRDAGGVVSISTLEPALVDRVKIGAAFIGAAEDMDTAKHGFALIEDQTFNEKYWTANGGGTFELKTGMSPSAALDDIFSSPSAYKFECATALVIVQYKAMRDLLGARDFDCVCAGLRIGPWQTEATLDRATSLSGNGDVEATPARRATLRAGDYGYFKNWDVSDAGRDAGWQGENVISLGGDRFYGHPFGIADGKSIVEHLNSQRRVGSTRSASFLDLRSSLSSSILREDRVDG